MGDYEEQRELARRLLGNVVRFNHMPPGSGRLCTAVQGDMVEIDGMTGLFGPELFTIDGETTAIPNLGKVKLK